MLDRLDWVIVGGESGFAVRACQIEWIEAIVNQCQTASIPVFVKQLGSYPLLDSKYLKLKSSKGDEISEFPSQLQIREYPYV